MHLLKNSGAQLDRRAELLWRRCWRRWKPLLFSPPFTGCCLLWSSYVKLYISEYLNNYKEMTRRRLLFFQHFDLIRCKVIRENTQSSAHSSALGLSSSCSPTTLSWFSLFLLSSMTHLSSVGVCVRVCLCLDIRSKMALCSYTSISDIVLFWVCAYLPWCPEQFFSLTSH